MAGKRKGAEDDRAIWPYIAGAVRVLRPRFVVLENVSAVLAVGEFQRAASDLAALGYDLRWTCLRASDVGAPHRRERLFVVATDTERGGRDSRFTRAAVTSGSPCGSAHSGPSAVSGDGPDRLEHRPIRPTTEQRAQMAAFIDAKQPGLLDDLGIPRTEPRMDALLPTPTTYDGGGSTLHPDRRKELNPKHSPELSELARHGLLGGNGPVNLLPTPTAADGARGQDFARTTVTLLPTPQARDSAGAKTPEQVEAAAGQFGPPMNLNDYVVNEAARWGKYAPAIHRWEQVLGRTAPSPTEPNRNGNPRLNPAFSEWMMGWPAGWVTDVPGLSRNDKLRIIGNGVVDRCAEAALQWLLSLEAVA